jgi:hypothetical protein
MKINTLDKLNHLLHYYVKKVIVFTFIIVGVFVSTSTFNSVKIEILSNSVDLNNQNESLTILDRDIEVFDTVFFSLILAQAVLVFQKKVTHDKKTIPNTISSEEHITKNNR